MDPSPIVIRPIRADDKEILVGGLHRLSPESRYRRFFAPKAKLSATQLRYLTEVDHHTHEALVAIDPRTGEGVGVARFIRSPTEPCGCSADRRASWVSTHDPLDVISSKLVVRAMARGRRPERRLRRC